MKGNHRGISVMHCVPFDIGQQKMSSGRKIRPCFSKTGKRSLLYPVPILISEFAFKELQGIFIVQFKNNCFGRGVIPKQRLSVNPVRKK